MVQLKISPSKLELFRSFKNARYEGTDYQVTADILCQVIRREQKLQSLALTQGDAFHKLIEKGTEGYQQLDGSILIQSNGQNVKFDNYTYRVINRYRELYPDMIHEIPLSIKLSVLGYDVVCNMRMDGLNPFPLRIHDHKTTSKVRGYLTDNDFYDSIQWRMYLMACDDVDIFQYDIFHFQHNNPQAVRSLEYYNFLMFRESDMENVVGEWLMGFIRFCEQYNLIDYLKK